MYRYVCEGCVAKQRITDRHHIGTSDEQLGGLSIDPRPITEMPHLAAPVIELQVQRLPALLADAGPLASRRRAIRCSWSTVCTPTPRQVVDFMTRLRTLRWSTICSLPPPTPRTAHVDDGAVAGGLRTETAPGSRGT
jgi:hypothetical protein